MSWAILPGIGSRIAMAAAVGTLVAVPALSVPSPAFAVPVPPADPDCMTDPSNPACDPPSNSDDPRCVDDPTSGTCLYSPWTADDDD
jgi:hypothetical protein